MKRKFLGLGLSFLLVAALVLTGCPAPVVEEPVVEKPLPSSIQPVIIMQGSDYEMGYQYGYQAASRIRWFVDTVWAHVLLEPLEEWKISYFGGGANTRAEIVEVLKGIQYYILKYTPEMIDILKGMADGSTDAGYPLTYIDTLLMNCEWSFAAMVSPEAHLPLDVEDLPPRQGQGCSTFAAWGSATTDGQLVAAQSSDGDFRDQNTLIWFPDTGNIVISSGAEAGGLGWTSAHNDKGLYVGLTAGPTARAIDNQFGLPFELVVLHVLRFANNATEARDMILDMQLALGKNYIVADTGGTAYIIETSSAHKVVREAGDFGEKDFLCMTNHFITEEMQVSQDSNYAYISWTSPARYNQLFDALTKYNGNVDVEFAKQTMRTPPVCNSDNRVVHVIVYEEGASPKSYICTGYAGYPVYAPWSFFPIAPTYSFYKLALEETPVGVVYAARLTARDYISQALTELNKLTFSDVEYAPLKELLEEAKAEFYKGFIAEDEGRLVENTSINSEALNEQLYKYHVALTASTRAQAIAKQVYNALVPVPTSPRDLGL